VYPWWSKGVRFSITIRQFAGVRRLIETIPEEDWTPIPYWIAGGADVAETTYTPFAGEKDAKPVRLIVRRVKPTPGSQLALLTLFSTEPLTLEAHACCTPDWTCRARGSMCTCERPAILSELRNPRPHYGGPSS
jgi:hypothetical protein